MLFEIGGKEVVIVIVWFLLVSDISMLIMVFSYVGILCMSVLLDKVVFVNFSKLIEKFIEEFEEMYECVKNVLVLIMEDMVKSRK